LALSPTGAEAKNFEHRVWFSSASERVAVTTTRSGAADALGRSEYSKPIPKANETDWNQKGNAGKAAQSDGAVLVKDDLLGRTAWRRSRKGTSGALQRTDRGAKRFRYQRPKTHFYTHNSMNPITLTFHFTAT
jgi:hypothetical protein